MKVQDMQRFVGLLSPRSPWPIFSQLTDVMLAVESAGVPLASYPLTFCVHSVKPASEVDLERQQNTPLTLRLDVHPWESGETPNVTGTSCER